MLGVCVVLLSVVVVGVLGVHTRPFFDPKCFSSDCSWSWETPIPGNQFCKRVVYNDSLDVCPNPFGAPADQNERPDKAQDVVLADWNKSFPSSENASTSEQYTCLRAMYTIKETAANKVKGIQFSLMGKEGLDMNLNYCLHLNFTRGDTTLDYYAVEDRVFSMDCFCGLKPGLEYSFTVRTLPVDGNPIDQDDTKVELDHIPPNCENQTKHNDVRCRKNAEARWSPDCFVVEQGTTSGEYDMLEVRFNVAPDNFNFDKYRIFIFQKVPGPTLLYADVNTVNAVDRMCLQELVSTLVHSFNISALDKSPGITYTAGVDPKPRVNQCMDANGETSCKRTHTSPFHLLADPCKGNPCGGDGQCLSQEGNYSCNCNPGYMEWNHVCVEDPCMAQTETGKAQCENGVCKYVYTPELDYYCICNKTFVYLKALKTCVANPCSLSEDTESTDCGPHGQCVENVTDDQVSYKCTCDEGYWFEDGKCKESTSVALVVGIATASCVVGLLLFVAAFFLYRRRNSGDNDPPHVLPAVLPQDPYSHRRILPIYSEDHPCHKKVIHCFCRFLREHCKCEVSLLDWEKYVGPTVKMWLDAEIEKADIVLLICSKGTGKKYKDKARRKKTSSSDGVYGDLFLQALTLLDEHSSADDACKKFVVCFFDYSSEEDIPTAFKRFAKYRLMKCMDSLFLRIHDKVKDSPGSTRRVKEVEEDSYVNLDMGKPLHAAIQEMKELIKKEPKWYQKHNKCTGSRETSLEVPKPNIFQQPLLLNSLSPQISTDSAYESTSGDTAQISADFFRDTASGSRSSNGSDYETSLRHFQSVPVNQSVAMEMPDLHENDIEAPTTRLFTDDIHLTMNPGPFFQVDDSFSDIQMGDAPTRLARTQSSV